MPIKPSQPNADLASKLTFIYGPPKIGKTTLAAAFPGACFLATEKGMDDLETPVARWEAEDGKYVITSWDVLMAATREVVDSGARTIILDTADNAYALCERATCAKYGVEYRNDDKLAYGKGTTLINSAFRAYLTQLSSLGIGVVLTSHATVEEQDTRAGKLKVSVPTLNEKVRPIILGMADLILFCDFDRRVDQQSGHMREERVIRLRPSQCYLAGARGAHMPDAIPLSYEALETAYSARSARGARG